MRSRDLEGFGPVGTNGPVEHPLIVRLEKLLIDAPGKLMLDDERRTVQEAIAALRALRDAPVVKLRLANVSNSIEFVLIVKDEDSDEVDRIRKYADGVRLVVVGDGNG